VSILDERVAELQVSRKTGRPTMLLSLIDGRGGVYFIVGSLPKRLVSLYLE